MTTNQRDSVHCISRPYINTAAALPAQMDSERTEQVSTLPPRWLAYYPMPHVCKEGCYSPDVWPFLLSDLASGERQLSRALDTTTVSIIERITNCRPSGEVGSLSFILVSLLTADSCMDSSQHKLTINVLISDNYQPMLPLKTNPQSSQKNKTYSYLN